MNPDTVSRTIQRRGTRLCGVGLLALLVLASPLWAQRGHDGRGFDHVFVIMMENTGYDTLIGNPNAPFINFAASTTGLASNYFGVAHPSQPNYVAATSGALNGVLDDNDITIDVPNIVDQLEGRHKTWKAYMQSYSLCTTPLDHACGNQLYERKHNPFISYNDVQTNPARVANIVDFSQFGTDLANNTVADYVWISPDQCNDMHGRGATPDDPCDFSQVPALIRARRHVPAEYSERDHDLEGLERELGHLHCLGRERLHGHRAGRLWRYERMLRREPGWRACGRIGDFEPAALRTHFRYAVQPLLDAVDDPGELETGLPGEHLRPAACASDAGTRRAAGTLAGLQIPRK